MKIIVVGANHAGTTAIRTLRRLDPSAEIVTYDRNNNISFLGCGIALWVSGELNDPQGLFYASPEILANEGIKVNMEHEVIGVDNKNQKIRVKNLQTNEEFEDSYDKLVLAIGSWPIIPPIEGIKQEGVHIVKWYQHGEIVKNANDNDDIKNVVVCGAGYIGIELVDAFYQKGKNVTLVDISDRIMPRYYDKPFTDCVEGAMQRDGVIFRGGETVVKFEGKDNVVSHVVTDKGSYPADLVIWAVGFRPATKMLENVVDLNKNGAIMVDQYMQTSDPNIFAVGDCVEVYDNAKKTSAYIALATNAVRTGVVAAVNIIKPAGLASPGFQGSNAINVFGWCLASTGVTETVAKDLGLDYDQITFSDNDRPEFMSSYKNVIIKIVWDKKTRKIIGAQVGSENNHTEVMYMFSLAIMKGVTIDELPLIDIFFLPHFNKPYNFITLAGLEVLGLNYFKK
ncbi:FAD-dependent oxidoreductase [Spiroplasma chrysopicola]|uniref:NADH oxidase n=1 Tax=Spiroplasma chrysopicola DF-1 TaxID=1276227 RepID=R4U2Z4_9MOLU|nr:FAD-dependent oxidoreductase [Spiroplasma chrysopicola]AGM24858.1 NADH oxidase [Spiroplasma chrysopicola DF-1]